MALRVEPLRRAELTNALGDPPARVHHARHNVRHQFHAPFFASVCAVNAATEIRMSPRRRDTAGGLLALGRLALGIGLLRGDV